VYSKDINRMPSFKIRSRHHDGTHLEGYLSFVFRDGWSFQCSWLCTVVNVQYNSLTDSFDEVLLVVSYNKDLL